MAKESAICWIEAQRSALEASPPRWRFLAVVQSKGARWEMRTSKIFVAKPNWRGKLPDGPVQRAVLDAFLAQLGREGWKQKYVAKEWFEVGLEQESETTGGFSPAGTTLVGDVDPSHPALSPAQFEFLVADLLTSLGFVDVARVGKAGDLGVDVKCGDGFGRSVLIQCKRYTRSSAIGSDDIQRFIGMITVEHRADRGVFVTTSSFTAPARKLAERHGIVLIDGTILDWLLSASGTSS